MKAAILKLPGLNKVISLRNVLLLGSVDNSQLLFVGLSFSKLSHTTKLNKSVISRFKNSCFSYRDLYIASASAI